MTFRNFSALLKRANFAERGDSNLTRDFKINQQILVTSLNGSDSTLGSHFTHPKDKNWKRTEEGVLTRMLSSVDVSTVISGNTCEL